MLSMDVLDAPLVADERLPWLARDDLQLCVCTRALSVAKTI